MCEVASSARAIHASSLLWAKWKSLCDGPFMPLLRRLDDFGRPETAFNVCSFYSIDARYRVGRATTREIWRHCWRCATTSDSLSEGSVTDDGEMWGNFPQTYSMVGIINGAMRLSRPWDEVV